MTRRTVLTGSLFTAALVLLGVLATWPIYATAVLLAVIGVSVLVGAGLAAASKFIPAWVTAIAVPLAVLLVGVAVAVPQRWASASPFPGVLWDVATGAVTGWKDLATVPLPVGDYRNLLVPVVVVFLVGTFAALRLAWQSGSVAGWAVVAGGAMPLFGLLFGRTTTSAPIAVGPLTIVAPVEILTGTLTVLVSVVWLAWRARDERRDALRRAADQSGVRSAGRHRAGKVRRASLAVGMVVVALVAGAAAAPALVDGRDRDVLRAGVLPDITLSEVVSPLAAYRSSFTDEAFVDELVRVTAVEGALPERLRLATLTSYDGAVFRVAAPDAQPFLRVPARLDVSGGAPYEIDVEIRGLTGVWLPTAGLLESVRFAGADAGTHASAFYYDRTTGTAVQTTGLSSGERYRLIGVMPTLTDLADARAPGISTAVELPESLVAWVKAQELGDDGAGLAEAIQRLRERGYLSHALQLDATAPAAWTTALAGYVFQPSAAGHSLARIDTMFTQLLEREQSAAEDGSLVAAVGDDEQFAVAASLLAQHWGFPSRVVVGFRLAGETAPVCADGVCDGGDLSAWIEVRDAAGTWIPVDVTPQFTNAVDSDARQQRDPENMTSVLPETAEEVSPPEPVQQDTVATDEPTQRGSDLSAVWAGLRVGGIALLAVALVIGPFLIVMIAKLVRRRSRRTSGDHVLAIAGGWEEYVDAAVDAGRDVPGHRTRTEVAAAYSTPAAARIAEVADRAVFAGSSTTEREAEAFWRLVEQDRRRFTTQWWKRLRAAVSLRSFSRHLGIAAVGPDASSRRGRRARRETTRTHT